MADAAYLGLEKLQSIVLAKVAFPHFLYFSVLGSKLHRKETREVVMAVTHGHQS